MDNIVKTNNGLYEKVDVKALIQEIKLARAEGKFDEEVGWSATIDHAADKEEMDKSDYGVLHTALNRAFSMWEDKAKHTRGEFVKFMIQTTAKSTNEVEGYVGVITMTLTMVKNGTPHRICAKSFGCKHLDEVGGTKWKYELLVAILSELLGVAHVLIDSMSKVKGSDVIREKLKVKKDEKDN